MGRALIFFRSQSLIFRHGHEKVRGSLSNVISIYINYPFSCQVEARYDIIIY